MGFIREPTLNNIECSKPAPRTYCPQKHRFFWEKQPLTQCAPEELRYIIQTCKNGALH